MNMDFKNMQNTIFIAIISAFVGSLRGANVSWLCFFIILFASKWFRLIYQVILFLIVMSIVVGLYGFFGLQEAGIFSSIPYSIFLSMILSYCTNSLNEKIGLRFDKIIDNLEKLVLNRFLQYKIVLIITILILLIIQPLLQPGYIFALDHIWPINGFLLSDMSLSYLIPILYNLLIKVMEGWIAEKILLVLVFLCGSFGIIYLLQYADHND